MKMNLFRERCSIVVGLSNITPDISKNTSKEEPRHDGYFGLINDVSEASQVVDIISAYKSLKLVMTKKRQRVLYRQVFLNRTMASRYKARGYKPPLVGIEATNSLSSVPNGVLSHIKRGYTVLNLVYQRRFSWSIGA